MSGKWCKNAALWIESLSKRGGVGAGRVVQGFF